MADSPSRLPLPPTLPDVPVTPPARKRPAPGRSHAKKSGTDMCYLSQLPVEIAFLILGHVPYRSLASLSRVNHYWRELTFQQDGILWYRLCQKHGFLADAPNHSAQHRWVLEDAQRQRPGLARALLLSRRRITSKDSQKMTDMPVDPSRPGNHPAQSKGALRPVVAQSARFVHGRVENWRDYFETMLILEREWIEGKPTVKELRGHGEAVLCVKALPRGERIVSGDRLGYLKVWCTVTQSCLKTFKRHMMGISSFAVQGDLLISGSWDSTIIIWKQTDEAPYLKALKIIDLGEQVMCMDLDDNLDLVIGAVSGVVKTISIKTCSSIDTFRPPLTHMCTAVSLNRTRVEAAVGPNYYAWDRTTKSQVGFIGDAHFENISCMKVDTNKRLIFTGSQDSKVRIFSWEPKPMLLRQYGGHRSGVRCMTLQDNMVITGSSDKTAMITFRDGYDSYGLDGISLDGLLGQEDDSADESERVAQPVSLPHPAYVNCVDADASMLVTGADDGVVRIFDFGCDLWRPPTPSSPRLCGQASLVSSTSSTCVLMAKSGRNKDSVGNRRQTWGTCALAVLMRAKAIMQESLVQNSKRAIPTSTPPLAWMNADEIYQRMIEWDMHPVSQGSTPRLTLNLALHMMAKSDSPTILLDSTTSPHRFSVK